MQADELSPLAIFVRDEFRRTTDPALLFFDRLPDACAASTVEKRGVSIDVELVATTLDCALMELDRAIGLLRARAIETILNAFEAQDLGSLRLALSRDLDPYRRYLQDDGLAVFVERAVRQDISYKIWLDGVAGHLVDKRAANGTNRTIHVFELEVRIVGANLTRWLSLAQTAQGNGAALRSIHVVENRWARPHDRPEPSPG